MSARGYVQHQRCVRNVPRQRSEIHERAILNEAVGPAYRRDAAERGFQPVDPTEWRQDTNQSVSVETLGDAHRPSATQPRSPPRGLAGGAVGVERRDGRTEKRVVGRPPVAEFGNVGLAEHDGPSIKQTLDYEELCSRT